MIRELSHKTYIASQGPQPHTVNDFWRMLWEYETHIIIMACNEYEGIKLKCQRYWPKKDEELEFENVNVTLVEEQENGDYILRIIQATLDEETRLLYQFHYTAWPDHGTPTNLNQILDLIALARHYQRVDVPPIVVHCSAGCGRTGTILAIDYTWSLLKLGKLDMNFDIYKLITEFRTQRQSIVQSEDQYIFVHMAVRELFQKHLALMDEHLYENVLSVEGACVTDSIEENDEVYQEMEPVNNNSSLIKNRLKKPPPVPNEKPEFSPRKSSSSSMSTKSSVSDPNISPNPPPKPDRIYLKESPTKSTIMQTISRLLSGSDMEEDMYVNISPEFKLSKPVPKWRSKKSVKKDSPDNNSTSGSYKTNTNDNNKPSVSIKPTTPVKPNIAKKPRASSSGSSCNSDNSRQSRSSNVEGTTTTIANELQEDEIVKPTVKGMQPNYENVPDQIFVPNQSRGGGIKQEQPSAGGVTYENVDVDEERNMDNEMKCKKKDTSPKSSKKELNSHDKSNSRIVLKTEENHTHSKNDMSPLSKDKPVFKAKPAKVGTDITNSIESGNSQINQESEKNPHKVTINMTPHDESDEFNITNSTRMSKLMNESLVLPKTNEIHHTSGVKQKRSGTSGTQGGIKPQRPIRERTYEEIDCIDVESPVSEARNSNVAGNVGIEYMDINDIPKSTLPIPTDRHVSSEFASSPGYADESVFDNGNNISDEETDRLAPPIPSKNFSGSDDSSSINSTDNISSVSGGQEKEKTGGKTLGKMMGKKFAKIHVFKKSTPPGSSTPFIGTPVALFFKKLPISFGHRVGKPKGPSTEGQGRRKRES